MLLVGSSGLLGRHLKAELQAQGHTSSLHELNQHGAAPFEETLRRIQPDTIFYTAGVVASSSLDELIEGNVLHLMRLLAACSKTGSRARIIVLGSSSVYGLPASLPITESFPLQPISPYGLSMQMRATLLSYFALAGLDVIEARLFNVIGPGLSEKTSVGSFLRQLAAMRHSPSPHVLKTGFLGHSRDFVDVRDAAFALTSLASSELSGHRVFNLCSGQSVLMQSVVEQLIRASDLPVDLQTEPARVRSLEMADNRGDCSLLVRQTGFKPKHALADSLRFALEGTL